MTLFINSALNKSQPLLCGIIRQLVYNQLIPNLVDELDSRDWNKTIRAGSGWEMALAFNLFSASILHWSWNSALAFNVCLLCIDSHLRAHACRGVLCVNDDVSTCRCVRTLPWLDTEILNSFFFCVSDKLGVRFLSTFTHTCFFSFSFPATLQRRTLSSTHSFPHCLSPVLLRSGIGLYLG